MLFRNNIFVCVVITFLTASCSADMTDQEHVATAKDYLDKGEHKAASIELKNALLQNPDNPQARLLLGKLYLETGNLPAAEKELRLAQSLGVNDESVLPLLASTYYYQGKYDEVLGLQSSTISETSQAQLLAIEGAALISQNRSDEASDKIAQALALDPGSVDARTQEARLAFTAGELDKARGLLDTLLKTDSSAASAWSLLGDLERADEELEKAETAYSKAIELQEENNQVDLLKRALVRIQLKMFAEAQNDVDLFRKTNPGYFEINYAQGLLHLSQQKYAEAKASFQLAVDANDKFLPALFYLGATNYQLGQLEQADSHLSKYILKNPTYIPARKILARIRLQEKDFAEAKELMQPVVLGKKDDREALGLLASAFIGLGEIDEGISLYEMSLALQPDSAADHLRLGSALNIKGENEKAVAMLEKAIELDPELHQAHIILIQSHLSHRNMDKALAAAQSYRDRFPDSATPYNMLGQVYLEREETAEAETAFKKALELVPGDTAAGNKLAAMAITAKNYDLAQGYFEEILKYHQNHLATLLAIIAFDELRGDEPAMLKHIQQAVDAHPDELQPRILLARYYLVNDEPEQVAVALGEPGQKQRDNPNVLGLIAWAQLEQGLFADARSSLNQLVEDQPDSAKVHYLLAKAYAGLGDREKLKTELETTITLDADHLTARLALTRLLLMDGQATPAAEQLEALKRISPENPEVIKLDASLAKAQGHHQQALDLYEEIFEQSASNTSMLALARQKWSMGDQDGSVQIQENWVSGHPEDIKARVTLANAYALQGRTEMSIQQYRKILELDNNSVIALNNLAMQMLDSDPKQALEYATKASELAPESATTIDTMAVALLKNGETELAQRKIERALAYNAQNPTIRYHGAMINAAAGYKAAAIKTLKELLEEDHSFPEKTEASQLLKSLQM